MKTWKILLVVVVALMAMPVMAEPTGDDIKCVADTTLSLTTGLGDPIGPSFMEFAQDGNAVVKLVWFMGGATARSAPNVARTLLLVLRDYGGPRSFYFPSGPDSADIDMVTAAEMVVTK